MDPVRRAEFDVRIALFRLRLFSALFTPPQLPADRWLLPAARSPIPSPESPAA
jgi:hypothetical protein